jgi:hypothetical protein
MMRDYGGNVSINFDALRHRQYHPHPRAEKNRQYRRRRLTAARTAPATSKMVHNGIEYGVMAAYGERPDRPMWAAGRTQLTLKRLRCVEHYRCA